MAATFPRIVSHLSLSPQAAGQLSYYFRRLRAESFTRTLSAVAGILVLGLYITATYVSPADSVNAASTNDIIYGGLSTVNPKADLLNIYKTGHDSYGHTGYAALFTAFGISYHDLENSRLATVNSNDHKLLSLGRNPHFNHPPEQTVVVGGTDYYLRPLYLWGDNIKYPVLEGTRSADGKYFAVMLHCGNIVVYSLPKPAAPTPKPAPVPAPQPAPAPAPAPAPTPTTQPPALSLPAPLPSGTPNVVQSKTASVADQSGKVLATADPSHPTAPADAGDTIQYQLIAANNGTATAKGYVMQEDLNDVLEYADILDPGDGTVDKGIISWPATDIEAGKSLIRTILVRVKSPIPTTPQSSSDPQSFDLKMDNFYGNLIDITLPQPAPKQVEAAAQPLPRTGPGEDLALFAAVAFIIYFWLRNRQLLTEIRILRLEHHGAG